MLNVRLGCAKLAVERTNRLTKYRFPHYTHCKRAPADFSTSFILGARYVHASRIQQDTECLSSEQISGLARYRLTLIEEATSSETEKSETLYWPLKTPRIWHICVFDANVDCLMTPRESVYYEYKYHEDRLD